LKESKERIGSLRVILKSGNSVQSARGELAKILRLPKFGKAFAELLKRDSATATLAKNSVRDFIKNSPDHTEKQKEAILALIR
jgi:hypothetical protein